MSTQEAHHIRLLLVEDEAIVAFSEKKVLENHGYEVITAHSGEQAVEIATDETGISLVLMDIDLGSGIDGTEAARRILNLRSLPIVFLTSHSEKEYVDRVKKITSYGYVLKNSGEFVLIEAVEMAFNLFDREVHQTETENRYKSVEKAAALGIWEMDIETGETFWSDEFFRICGYEPGSIIPNTDSGFSLIHEDDKDRAAQAVTETIDTGKPYAIEKRIVRPDGEIRWVHSIGEVKVDEKGTPKTLVGSFQDITERKQAEEALAQKTRLLERSQELANLGSWEWDIVRDTWHFSEQWKTLHGLSDNDVGTEKLLELAHPDDAPDIEKAFTDARERGDTYDIEHRIVRADDKKIRHIRALGEAEFDQVTGRPVRMVGATQDITERKQAEEDLSKSEERFRHMVNTAPLGIAIVDSLTDEFFLVNPAMSRITGRSVEELERIDWVSITHPDDIQPDKEKMAELNAGKISGFQLDKRYLHADGQYLSVKITVAPMHVTGKSNPHHVLMVEDITERKQAEKEIQKQLSEKETLLREVHHRVKNNIAQIESLLSLQAGSTANAEVKAALQDAISRVQSMRVLYDKLLLSKDLGEISIKDYAEGLIDSLAMAFDSEKNITIEKHISDFMIAARKAISIGIIINELLTNVFKYAFYDRNSGMVSVSIDKEEHKVTLIIRDDGVGIDEKVMDNESPGFGLTVVKMLVEQLGGTYNVVNENGAKSVITFPRLSGHSV